MSIQLGLTAGMVGMVNLLHFHFSTLSGKPLPELLLAEERPAHETGVNIASLE